MKTNIGTGISIVGNKENEEKFFKLTADERFELIKETMNSITNILVYSGIPVNNFPGILHTQAELLEDKFKIIKNKGKQ